MERQEALSASAASASVSLDARGSLARLLGLVTPVHQHEASTALLVMLEASLVLCAYSCIKPLPFKVVEDATDYSFNSTVRNMLWLPTSRHTKYVAKQVTDTFFVRVGDFASAVLIFVGAHLLVWPARVFFCINGAAVLAWFFVARAILAKHRALTSVGEVARSDGASTADDSLQRAPVIAVSDVVASGRLQVP